MIRVVTWNIWFEKVWDGRIESLIKVIQEQDPDFICLQEVIDASRKMIFDNPWIQENYFAKGGCASGNEFI